MKLICIFALIFLFSINGFAQNKPSWLTSLEKIIKQKERNLKIRNIEEHEKRGGYNFIIEFDDFRSHIQIIKYGDADIAPDVLFAKDVKSYNETSGKNSKKKNLENFGDEGYIWANINNKGETRIYFRKERIFVNIYTTSENLARSLAKYVAEQMPKADDYPSSPIASTGQASRASSQSASSSGVCGCL